MGDPTKKPPPLRLVVEGISKRFGATLALKQVDLQVDSGEVLALVGENGAGKSTLMKILSGAHKSDSGSMQLDGQNYQPRNPLDARNQGVAMIYQELTLANHLSVMENIVLGSEPSIGPLVNWAAMKQVATQALDEIGLGDLSPNRLVKTLSIAQQQMVEIARAVALDCKILILDEPTSSLTKAGIEQLFALIRKLKKRGIAVIYISHFLEEVQEISDRITVLRDGQTVGTRVNNNIAPAEIVKMMVGRDVDDLYPRSNRPEAGEVVLSCDKIGGVKLPQNATLELKRGRVYGIAGLVGAGRTELMRAIFGLDAIKTGSIKVGVYSGAANPQQRWGQGVGMVSENRKEEGLALNLSIADNITLSSLNELGPVNLVLPSQQKQKSKKWVEKIAVKCAGPGQRVDALSGGNQQKVAIARLLHADVDVLLLDEPTRGIDVGSKAQIYDLIDQLACGTDAADTQAKSVLVISSYLPELLGICDAIAVMDRGKLSSFLPTEQWSEQRLMLVATGQEKV
ncbi:MAG: sugar ABC transporter ATP-binding protein [Planctomycetota bacterium]